MQTKKLNIGCGTHIVPGFINLDISALPGVDVVHDIEKLPLPFATDEFDEILCQDVLEHVEYIPVLKDIYRITKPGGTVTIRVPHFTSRHNFIDPTHKKLFSINTFDFFVRGSFQQDGRGYYFDFAFSSATTRITFEHDSPIFFLNGLVEKFVNKNKRRQQMYEATFLARLFPAGNIIVTLVK